MTASALSHVRRRIIRDAIECHQAKRDALAAALRATPSMAERSQLLWQHADACRCIAAFEAELAKA